MHFFLLAMLLMTISTAAIAEENVAEVVDIEGNSLPWLTPDQKKEKPSFLSTTTTDEAPAKSAEEQSQGLKKSTEIEAVINFQVVYTPSGFNLAQDHLQVIDAALALAPRHREHRRLSLKSYASARKGHSSEPRRIALKRATAVRDYLVAKGFSERNISLQILGVETDIPPYDRIDIVEFPTSF